MQQSIDFGQLARQRILREVRLPNTKTASGATVSTKLLLAFLKAVNARLPHCVYPIEVLAQEAGMHPRSAKRCIEVLRDVHHVLGVEERKDLRTKTQLPSRYTIDWQELIREELNPTSLKWLKPKQGTSSEPGGRVSEPGGRVSEPGGRVSLYKKQANAREQEIQERSHSMRSPDDASQSEGDAGQRQDLSSVNWGAVEAMAKNLARKIPPRSKADRMAWVKYAVLAEIVFSEDWLMDAAEAVLAGKSRTIPQRHLVGVLSRKAQECIGPETDLAALARGIWIEADQVEACLPWPPSTAGRLSST